MKEVIDRYKKRNGDGVYTVKEMTMYLVEKVDHIDRRLAKKATNIAVNRSNIRNLWIVLTIIVSVAITLKVFV